MARSPHATVAINCESAFEAGHRDCTRSSAGDRGCLTLGCWCELQSKRQLRTVTFMNGRL